MKKSDMYRVLANKIGVAETWFDKGDYEESCKWYLNASAYIEKVGIEYNTITKKYFNRLGELGENLGKVGF